MSAKETVEKFIHQQGWSDTSVIDLLCEFIDNGKPLCSLELYLKLKADKENAMAEENDEPNHEYHPGVDGPR